MSFYTDEELKGLGFKAIGIKVKLSKLASVYGYENIEIGDHTRIDDFCVISSGKEGIIIGKYVHVACFSLIIGKAKIELHDFSGLSSRVSIYSSSDDYSGDFLTNPTVPVEFTNVIHKPVVIGKHVIIGTNSTVLPGVEIRNGAAIGAHSLVSENIGENVIAFGVPAKKKSNRNTLMFDLENKFITK